MSTSYATHNHEYIAKMEECLGIKYSDEQKAMILQHGAPMNGIALAGAGKSNTIVGKINYIEDIHGVPGERIAAIAFNREARIELERRYKNLRAGLGKPARVKFFTFHALFNKIVTETQKNITVSQPKELNREFARLFRTFVPEPTDEKRDNMRNLISFMINSLIGFEELAKTDKFIESGFTLEEVKNVWEHFYDYKRKQRLIDFDDMQLIAYRLLLNFESVRERYANMFDYWIIDEFQDSNKIQVEIMKMLVKDTAKLNTIGDDDQAIYAFRGSDSTYIVNFNDHFPGAEKVVLTTNYRCPENILEYADRMIQFNKVRVPKFMRAAKPGGNVRFVPAKTLTASSKFIADEIDRKYKSGIHPSKMAVLYRNNNQAMFVVDMLIQKGIPLRVSSKESMVYNHWITADILDIIDFAQNQTNPRLFEKVGTKVISYIKRNDVKQVAQQMAATGEPWYNFINSVTSRETETILHSINKLIKEDNGKVCHAIDMLQSKYLEFAKFASRSKDITEDEVMDILDYLRYLGDRTYVQLLRYLQQAGSLIKSFEEDENAVTMTTMHKVKGLEYPHVYLLHIGEDVMPNTKILNRLEKNLGMPAVNRHIEEERRLFYVAITRAIEESVIVYPEGSASRYITEMLPKGKNIWDVSEKLKTFMGEIDMEGNDMKEDHEDSETSVKSPV